MDKIDFKRELKHLYQPSAKAFSLVEVPEMQFLMVDGHGDPNTAQSYTEAVEGLYGVAYPLKFMSKKELGRDYTVPPLEGLWWADEVESFSSARDKSRWDWTMMIMLPDWIDQEMFEAGVAQAGEKKDLPALPLLRLESYHEGLSAQILYFGPYDGEGPTIAKMHHEFMPANQCEPRGKHHEIYLSDPRRTAPEKLKTVIRQPVRKIG